MNYPKPFHQDSSSDFTSTRHWHYFMPMHKALFLPRSRKYSVLIPFVSLYQLIQNALWFGIFPFPLTSPCCWQTKHSRKPIMFKTSASNTQAGGERGGAADSMQFHLPPHTLRRAVLCISPI